MKNLLFFCFVLLGVIIPWNGESSSFQFSFQSDPEEEIELAVGEITIEVYNSSGELIYETSVDSSTQSSISIDVTEWNSGLYEIRFVNTTENYLYGSFEIQ